MSPETNPFTQEMRRLGFAFFRNGRVKELDTSEEGFRAMVWGPDGLARSELYPNDKGLAVHCTCDTFREHRSCEHLWAVLLEAKECDWQPVARSAIATLLDSEDGSQLSPDWRTELRWLASEAKIERESQFSHFAVEQRQIIFLLEQVSDFEDEICHVQLRVRTRDSAGRWQKSNPLNASEQLKGLSLEDEQIIRVFRQAHVAFSDYEWRRYLRTDRELGSKITLDRGNIDLLLPLFARSGRLFLGTEEDLSNLIWDGDRPWRFQMSIVSSPSNEDITVDLVGEFARDGELLPLAETIPLSHTLVICQSRVLALEETSEFYWVNQLCRMNFTGIPAEDRDDLIRHLLAFHPQPPLLLEEAWTRSQGTPRGRVVVERESAPTQGRKMTRLLCRVYFDYGNGLVIEAASGSSIAGWASSHNAIARDTEAEVELLKELFGAGARRVRESDDLSQVSTTKSGLRRMVVELGRRNWIVEAEGKSYRTGGTFRLSVSSGIDWFQVAGTIDFDGQQVTLPKILSRIQRGTNLIELGDGSVGVLPDEWLHEVGLLASLGQAQGGSWRFSPSQGWILNALLSARPDVTMDRDFEAYRDRLAAFDGIRPRQESSSFQGTLRSYQREALGWLTFLRDFGLGGCLADDMGLGKTIEWLAFLESLRSAKGAQGPHLVIVPRSVVGNWLREAQKFTPKLEVIDCSRAERQERLQNLHKGDLALTTYGTLRRDILLLRDIAFDTIALDEAQAIKNAHSQTAKSAKLLQAHQRIALSGTPIENNIGELWSLFDFLNPGMLGNTRRFQTLALTDNGAVSTNTALSTLATAIRPFVLRRTKEQVLTDLPEKLEQTIYCDMGPKQSELYEELKAHYQGLLLTRGKNVAAPDPNNMQVLEALLRLRQLACHPRLLDPDRLNDESIKLTVLLEHLEDVRSGGHKALVFSQFTKFLALIREALDEADIPFEYLDGKTRKRDAKIDRFQQDPECPVFLISLKAGGLGLNLTAADYVFILDPWWNPATESQAIDRAHRIGQEKRVFAYRLVTKDTVEERILELHEGKRQLTESLIRADQELLRSITQKDLEKLLR